MTHSSFAMTEDLLKEFEKANNVNNHPWLADLVIARAKKSRRVLNRMAAVLEEKGNPGNLVSLRGIVRLFVPIP